MSAAGNLNVFIWKEPDFSLLGEVLSFIKDQQPSEKDVVILHCSESYAVENSISLIFYLFVKCQHFKVFQRAKPMFLNPKDLYQAAELCIERLKLESKNTDEDVIMRCLDSYKSGLQETTSMCKSASKLKEFVSQNNCVDIWQMLNSFQKCESSVNEFIKHVSELKFLILGMADMYVFKEVMSFFNCGTSIISIEVETPLNVSLQGSPSSVQQSSTITSQSISLDEFHTEKLLHLESATEEYCREIVTSFLSLLVNSRDELALSKVMISPFINLSHEAFTHLKHLAVENEMPMCQTVISYVTRVRLGGKGYAPPENCPLQPHLKCLELFVDTLNQLQTIVEEDLTPKSSIKKLINILKKKLLKCESGKLKRASVEKASEQLHSITDRVLEFAKSQQCFSSTPQICQETLDILYYLVNYINCMCLTFDPEKIMKQRMCKRTPINLPPLLGYFRSPEEESTCEENSVVNEDSIVSNDSSIGFPPPLMSYFHNSDNSCSQASAASSCTSTPTKTSFKDCIKMKKTIEEIDLLESSKNATCVQVNNRKRPALSNIANIDTKTSDKKAKTEKVAVKVKKTCGSLTKKNVKKTNLSKKFKLVEGQGKITNFFTISQK